MKLLDTVLDSLAARLQKRIVGRDQSQAYRDAGQKGCGFSVESLMAENLAALMLLNFQMPIGGGTERAKWLDDVSDEFCGRVLERAQAQAFITGDCLIVPSWNGRGMDAAIVPASKFAILECNGDELLNVAYVVDEKQLRSGSKYTLLRTIDLVKYATETGETATGCRYRTFIAKDGSVTNEPLSNFPEWAANNEESWLVPNTSRLLVARIKSPTQNPNEPNAAKGIPLCYGCSDPIREVHYLTEQMHSEFELSEKAIIADKRLFVKRPIMDGGETVGYKLELPKGRERLFMSMKGNGEAPDIHEWSPSIQLQPYLDNLDFQFKRIEKFVGCDSGVISTPNDMNYQNVDNVRKSTIHTQSLIATCRGITGRALLHLCEIWDTLANYYGITPVGDWEPLLKWSDDYINTFADQQNAILAGQSIGATDAYDYRQFVMGESPETARQRVDEIKAAQGSVAALLD